jgi:diadenylate cyclase
MFSQLIQAVFGNGLLHALRALVEIGILAYCIYQLIRVMRGSRAVPVAFGVGLLIVAYFLASLTGLSAIQTVLETLAPYAGIALIIIFQTEIRAALRELALKFSPTARSRRERFEYEDIVFAISQLSASRVGALIVLERESGLKTFIQSGVSLQAQLSSDLLVSIFQRSSPMHDGGVIIQKGRIAAAACFLPLTTNPGLVSSLGTRHRAAIGVTEESDCVALVVSETDGRISIASAGAIERGVSMDRLRLRLIEFFGPVVAPPQGSGPEQRQTLSAVEPAAPAAVPPAASVAAQDRS